MRTMEASTDPKEQKRTPLDDVHEALGAKMAPFAGWVMPIEYEGALAEHKAVRERVGLFDLTHLGKVDVTGPGAFGMLQSVITNDLGKAAVGEALYNLVLNEGGGVIEDLIVYRLADERFFVVPNAANAQRVLQILEETPSEDRLHLMYHQDWCFLAVQGPESVHVMRRLFPDAGDLAFMQCIEAEYRRRPVILTRSGYTGEVGFELFTYQDVAHELWADLTEAMAPFGGQPCGLAARDVLPGRRIVATSMSNLGLEAALAHHGIEVVRCDVGDRAVVDTMRRRGVVLGGSGQGEQIAANKVPGVRAALCNDLYTARLSREHNDANVICFGERVLGAELAKTVLAAFVSAAFEGGRHQGRVDKIELE